MIDLTEETTINLKQVAEHVPVGRRGRPLHLSTVLRWILHGTKAPSGQIVRLEGIRLGGKWITSVQAVQRFSERLTPSLEVAERPSPTRTKRERASQRAARELEKLGV